ncbi:MAG: hypothetical protein Q7K42_04095 [Candidatus Diapherotrites archaeon]|nr:hypothetical protein [Candidatus Diapherotrites archaeon]
MAGNTANSVKSIGHIVVLIALLVGLLGLLTWSGIVQCSVIPGYCDVYYSVLGEPKILIYEGNDGIGNPAQLQKVLTDPQFLNLRADLKHYNFLSIENLKEYDLIIVEHAKTLPTKKLKDLTDYINSGKKIIWIGDSGTQMPLSEQSKDLFLYRDEVYSDKPHEKIGAWARKTEEGKVLNLENFISVHYLGNYCDVNSRCINPKGRTGQFIPTDTDNPLIYGIRSDLPYYGDFAIVEDIAGLGTKIVMSIDAGQPIKNSEPENITPAIVTSGTVNSKITYYAFPLEQLLEEPNQAPTLLENMYRGTFK